MNFQKLFTYLLLGFAVFLRVLSYGRNRSLFYDEINLARNYAEKDYVQLLGHLDYNQHAPPFFSWIVKFLTDIFGMQEYALRLFPFVAGVASIFLFYKIAKRFLSQTPLWFALILFGFSSYLLEYGTEVKQYSTDVFWSCLLIYLALKFPLKSRQSGLSWAALGFVVVWFSMPSVFILSGIGLYFAYHIYSNHPNLFINKIGLLSVVIVCWLMSFALLYQVNLQHSLGSDQLESFHKPFFLKVNDFSQTGEVLIGIIRSIVGHTAVPIVFSFLCLFLGFNRLFRQHKAYLILFSVPILVCFFASFLQQYSLIIRLTVFLFPILILVISIGLSSLYQQGKGLQKNVNKLYFLLVSVLAISCLLGRSAVRYLSQPLVKEDARTVLKELAQEEVSHTTLILTDGGKPSFLFYTKYYEPRIDIEAKNIVIVEEDMTLEKAFAKYSKSSPLWIFDSHTFGGEQEVLQQKIKKKATIQKTLKSKSTWAFELITPPIHTLQ